MREPYALQGARTVPGRGRGSNPAPLFDSMKDFITNSFNKVMPLKTFGHRWEQSSEGAQSKVFRASHIKSMLKIFMSLSGHIKKLPDRFYES